ncbi:hypothetical protein DCC79_13175, partial [bacterium]
LPAAGAWRPWGPGWRAAVGRWLPTARQQAPAGIGAAALAPSEGRADGARAWPLALARGGGIYHLAGFDGTSAGALEITAPAEAYNTGGAASRCPNAVSGAVVAAWSVDEGAWLPVPGTTINPPPPGSLSFKAATSIRLPAALAGRPARGDGAAGADASPVALYTVGFDVATPVLTPTLAAGAVLTALPAVLGHARDALAGVKGQTGVQATLRGAAVSVAYDPDTGDVRVPEGARGLGGLTSGPAKLVITVADGFCNTATASIDVTLDTGIAATPTATPRSTASPGASPTATPTGGTRPPPTATPTPSRTPTRGPTLTPSATVTPGGPTVTPTPTGEVSPTAVPTRRLYLPYTQVRR